MNKHLKNLSYLLRHKWYVYQYGRKLGLSRWQLITHDWSKFLPDEWRGYTNYFYGMPAPPPTMLRGEPVWAADDVLRHRIRQAYEGAANAAFQAHYRRQPHHWQYWLRATDSGKLDPIEMPVKYAKEMAADWLAANKATGNPQTPLEWLEFRRPVFAKGIHPHSLTLVEHYLRQFAE